MKRNWIFSFESFTDQNLEMLNIYQCFVYTCKAAHVYIGWPLWFASLDSKVKLAQDLHRSVIADRNVFLRYMQLLLSKQPTTVIHAERPKEQETVTTTICGQLQQLYHPPLHGYIGRNTISPIYTINWHSSSQRPVSWDGKLYGTQTSFCPFRRTDWHNDDITIFKTVPKYQYSPHHNHFHISLNSHCGTSKELSYLYDHSTAVTELLWERVQVHLCIHYNRNNKVEEMNGPRHVDDPNALVEFTADSGRVEAYPFVTELLHLFASLPYRNRWVVPTLAPTTLNMGGTCEVIVKMRGNNAFKILSTEVGVVKL